ncbi:MAG TPA: LD-carboxypeptidase [Candidatus Binataceae bacterium]|nr:LD-carboxypeptidase [Candidatus Binataceae bacterium]
MASGQEKAAPIKPRALRPGDTIGVVSAAAAVEKQALERGLELVRALGFRARVSKHVLERDDILAGSDRQRADELQAFFADPDIAAILVARGGYGSGRILPLLDFEAIALTPKPFVGFSDLTFVLNPIVERARMVAFHGPMLAIDHQIEERNRRSFEHLGKVLLGKIDHFEMEAPEVIHPGAAEGELMGGCLSIIVAMLATPFAPNFDGKILFLEEVGERAYRIDRMLVQLRQSGALARCAGVVFGAIRPYGNEENEARMIRRFVAEQTSALGIPVLFGIDAGHFTNNLTLPFGVRARIDTTSRCLTVLESGVR